MTKEQIITALHNLSKHELGEVINRANAILKYGLYGVAAETLPNGRRAHHSGVSSTAGTDPYDFALAVLARVSQESGRDHRPVVILKSHPAYKAFYAAIPSVIKHIEGFAPGRTNIATVLRMAYEHMAQERGMGAILLMTHTDTIPLMLSQMFPGYYEAGLMRIMFKKLAHTKETK